MIVMETFDLDSCFHISGFLPMKALAFRYSVISRSVGTTSMQA